MYAAFSPLSTRQAVAFEERTAPPRGGHAYERLPLASRNVAYGSQISYAASAYGLDPKLLAAVAAQETGGPDANSGRNVVGDGGHGHGLFQIDDRSHSFASTAAAMDPQQNADYAASMLSSLITSNGGDIHAALSAYNSGSPTATGTKTTWSDGTTLGYADSVMRHYADLGGSSAAANKNGTSVLGQARADNYLNSINVSSLQNLASQNGSGSSLGSVLGHRPHTSATAHDSHTVSAADFGAESDDD